MVAEAANGGNVNDWQQQASSPGPVRIPWAWQAPRNLEHSPLVENVLILPVRGVYWFVGKYHLTLLPQLGLCAPSLGKEMLETCGQCTCLAFGHPSHA